MKNLINLCLILSILLMTLTAIYSAIVPIVCEYYILLITDINTVASDLIIISYVVSVSIYTSFFLLSLSAIITTIESFKKGGN